MRTVAVDVPTVEVKNHPGRHGVGCAAAGSATALIGAAGVWGGLVAVFGSAPQVSIGWLLPLSGVVLHLDPLGGFFSVLIGAVAVPVGVYTVGYARHERWPALSLTVLPLFVAAMLLVAAAGSIPTFLLAWELMALASVLLVITDHDRAEVRSAALFYAAMTQLGFVAILVGLMVMATSVGADRFTEMTVVPEPLRDVVFVLTVAGFGSKAGLVPLHAWLARAHPEAPSPVSALMSAAMVTLGVYGIIRIDLVLIGPGPRWWAVLLLLVGAASALYGVLQASVATDVKRLLAYSTTDNMGLITMALGASLLLSGAGAPEAAAIAAVAALLHLLAHAAFKSLGFMAAGSVLAATGLRDLDRMGGLARPMPVTTVLFGVAALGACGLPLGAGFVSEWLLVQALVHAGTGGDVVVALAAPLAVGAVALTTGLSVAAMVKAFGIGFLARPRSAAARQARESAASMLTAMVIVAVGCVVLALAPVAAAAVVARAVNVMPTDVMPTARSAAPAVDFAAVIRLPGLGGSIAPGLLATAFVAALLATVVAMRWRARRRPPTVQLPLWACGADDLTPRMQYTATSFAEPLQRVFNDVLRPASDIDVTHHSESRYMVSAITYRNRIADAVEIRLYHPVVTGVKRAAEVVRRAHNGSVHLYLAYGALGVLVVLVIAR